MSSSRDTRRQAYERLVGQPVAQGRFVITKLLGFGGMGAVYEAIQRNMNRKVALKLIPTHDPTIVARFEREANTISKLRHPNTITVFDFGQSEDGFLFLSMELLEGRTLTDEIAEGPLDAARAVHIATQICRSLSEAHRAGIVHRDVKPDNIILIRVDDDPDVVKVLDFGIAKAVMGEDDVQLTGDGRIIGTPRYMSPEQILAEPLDHRSDIYSLGCILFEMLCGAPPFQQASTTALMISHTQDPPPAFAQRLDPGALGTMPGGLERVVRKALSKSPRDRHESCDALREDLDAALKGVLVPGYDDHDALQTAAALPPLDAVTSGARPQPAFAQASSGATSESPITTRNATPKFLVAGIALLVLLIAGLLGVSALRAPAEPTANPDQHSQSPAPPIEVKPTAAPVEEPVVAREEPPGAIRLTINSEPAGAKVYQGDGFLGKTPLVVPVKPELKKHLFRLVLAGHEDLAVMIPVDPQAGDEVERWYELEKKAEAKAPARRPTRAKTTPRRDPTPEPEKKSEPQVDLLQDGPKAKVGIIGN